MSEDKQVIQKNSKKIRNDIILVAVLLSVVLIAIVCLLIFRKAGDTVEVTVDGASFGKYSLIEDKTIEIKSENGLNVLVIKDGKAYIDHANCPDGICSAHRPISHDKESIICLPNKVVVTVRSHEANQPDIIS